MMRPHRAIPLLVILGATLLGGSSCRDEKEVTRVPAGLKVQSAIPAFPDRSVYPPDYVLYDVTYPTTLRYDLNEVASTEEITLHWLSQPSTHPSLPGVPVFDDSNSYWDASNPTGSVITPNTGTKIEIKSVSARGNFMQVQVR